MGLFVGGNSSSNGGGTAIYGDGSDGAVTISSNTTLTADKFYSSLTVDATFTLNADDFFIYCTGIITNNGVISCDGNNASGITAGAVVGLGSFAFDPTAAGGAGRSTSGSGNGGGGKSVSLGGAGGIGGTSGVVFAGGAGGTKTAPTGGQGNGFRLPIIGLNHRFTSSYDPGGGTGGGGGGVNLGTGTATSGAGGGAGGILPIISRTIINNGIISADGGDGSAAVSTGDANAGGGGGGGAGVVYLVYNTLVNNGTIRADGGSGGAHSGLLSADGASGNTGTVIQIQKLLYRSEIFSLKSLTYYFDSKALIIKSNLVSTRAIRSTMALKPSRKSFCSRAKA